MKNVLLIGATGTAGSAVAERLLSETDYHVTLFSRHARDSYNDDERTTVVDGDALCMPDLMGAMRGQDAVYCAVSGAALPRVAECIVAAMMACRVERLIFMCAVGIYNEIPDEMDGEDNLDNEPGQIPNRLAADVVEGSGLNYTVLRPGYLREGGEDDYVLSVKDEPARGYITTIPSLSKFAVHLLADDAAYSKESVSITRDAAACQAEVFGMILSGN